MVELLYGNEPYLLNDYIQKKTDGLNSMNVKNFYELSKEVFSICNQYPFFSDRQVVIVQLSQLDNNDDLNKYIENPASHTDLFIKVSDIDKRTKMFLNLKKKGMTREFTKLSNEMFCKFVMRELKRKGCKISEDNFQYFIRRCSYLELEDINLYNVKLYIQQLCMNDDVISREEIDIFVEKKVHEKIFELTNAMISGEKNRLFSLASDFIYERENIIGMLSLILRAFRLAYKLSLFPEVPLKEKAQMLGVSTYQLKGLDKISSFQSQSIMSIMQTAVNDIKNGGLGELIFYKSLAESVEILGYPGIAN